MEKPVDSRRLGCGECVSAASFDLDFTMAFQPIVKPASREVFAYEALVRGINNEPAGEVFLSVNEKNRYRFDQSCRAKAIKLAAELKIPCFLSINFMPNAVYRPELCIRTTLAAARAYGFPLQRIIFEITESEKVDDFPHLRKIVEYYHKQGFKTAIDDFGAGYSGLNLLSELQTDFIKLDMALIRHIDEDRVRQSIIRAIMQVAKEISSAVIAEGVESEEEWRTLESLGVELYQGFYFAKPTFQGVSEHVHFPASP